MTLGNTYDGQTVRVRLRIGADADGDEVVVYCAGGVRSDKFVGTYADQAQQLGISLKSLPGGVQRWG